MARKFTWFPKLTDIVNEVANDFPDSVGELVVGITNYGTYGVEPEFDNKVLKYAFMAVREDIDNSISAREKGGKGGRPKGSTERQGKADSQTVEPKGNSSEVPENKADSGSDNSKANSGCSEPEYNLVETQTKPTNNLTETQTEPDLANQKPPYTVNQSIPYQSIPIHTKGIEGEKRKRFTPPTPQEVTKYVEEYAPRRFPWFDPGSFDAETFCDFYASKGWNVGKSPMKDWRAAVRRWVREDCEKNQERKGVNGNADLSAFAEYLD